MKTAWQRDRSSHNMSDEVWIRSVFPFYLEVFFVHENKWEGNVSDGALKYSAKTHPSKEEAQAACEARTWEIIRHMVLDLGGEGAVL